MLKRPSTKRKSKTSEEISLPLVPIMDAMVTLISFLLFSASFLAIVVIDSPAPVLADPKEVLEKSKQPPLNLTLRIQEKAMFIEGGFGNLVNRRIPNRPDDGGYDLEALHTALIEIKNRFPDETKLILMPDLGVSYDQIVQIMDAARRFEKTDPSMFKKNPLTGVDEAETKLFPEFIFGNLLSSIDRLNGPIKGGVA
jgi:biopolymer transport protein ExbD